MWLVGSRFSLNADSTFSLRHLPTWLLIIGYPAFWLEMALKSGPHTSAAASVLFIWLTIFLLHIFRKRSGVSSQLKLSPSFYVWGIPILLILMISFFQSILPLHLPQEADALNYHYALPRQHLILGTFKHLPWSTADLWPLPIQYGLSPFWFVCDLPNKFPQFLFLLGLFSLTWSMSARLTTNAFSRWLAVAALAGSHGLAIQFGTAMLDIPMAYLALASIESLLSGRPRLAALELSFFAWGKSFVPLEVACILVVALTARWFGKRCGFTWRLGFDENPLDNSVAWKTFVLTFLASSVAIAGPFLAKSIYYAGTPLFPFGTFCLGGKLMHPEPLRQAVTTAAQDMVAMRNAYGEGRNLVDLLAHVWRVSVPSRGVNNAFDYPLGLPFLLLAAPFLYLFGHSLARRRIPLLAGLAILLWGMWWMGSQQSRWLYFPLILIILTTTTHPLAQENRALQVGLWIALPLVLLSIFRASAPDLKIWPQAALRLQDRDLLNRSRQWHQLIPMPVQDKEVAYAEVPVVVVQGAAAWVLDVH